MVNIETLTERLIDYNPELTNRLIGYSKMEKNLHFTMSYFHQEVERTYDLYSTTVYNNKMTNKDSVKGLAELTEELAKIKGGSLDIFRISFFDLTFVIIFKSSNGPYVGSYESIAFGNRNNI